MIQPLLFEMSELEILRSEVKELTKIMGNVRRGMFSRHDELEQKFNALKDETEKLRASNQELRQQLQDALFSLPDSCEPGLKSISTPVSFLMMSSHTSSTGLSLPKK